MNKADWGKTNPFTFEHVRSEAAFMNLPEEFNFQGEKSTIKIDRLLWEPSMRLPCYLNTYASPQEPFSAPRFQINGKLWMSIVPRELASQWVPLMQATGKVGVAGLGMGYFALRAASFDDITEVVVHELNPDVITYFNRVFEGRPELSKIRIVQGDFRELWQTESFDYYFNDVYLEIGATEGQLDHAQEAFKMGNIKTYWYWGFDHHLFECLLDHRFEALTYIFENLELQRLFKFRNDIDKTDIFDKRSDFEKMNAALSARVDKMTGTVDGFEI
jgi:hypothetical protein